MIISEALGLENFITELGQNLMPVGLAKDSPERKSVRYC
jgi:hypothetical protein